LFGLFLNPEDGSTLHYHRYENLKCGILLMKMFNISAIYFQTRFSNLYMHYEYPSIISGTVAVSGQKLIFGLLAIITLEVVLFLAYAPFPALQPFLNAPWKSCSVRVFSTALITSIVSKRRPFSFIFNGGTEKSRWVRTTVVFFV
jgi:hypothetical protein